MDDERAANRRQQVVLYGAPLAYRVQVLTVALGISQARLAHAIGISSPYLSQLVSAHRVKIGDPAVLARMRMLHGWCTVHPGPRNPTVVYREVDALLKDVAHMHWDWVSGLQAG